MFYRGKHVEDFAKRTLTNLKFIDKEKKEDKDVFEVTQFVNSMLGLLVFPQQEFTDNIPEISLEELKERGWPEIKAIEGKLKKDNLRQLVRVLRNGIAHFNVEFFADSSDKIAGFYIWNECCCGNVTWKAKLDLETLRAFVEKFVNLIVNDNLG